MLCAGVRAIERNGWVRQCSRRKLFCLPLASTRPFVRPYNGFGTRVYDKASGDQYFSGVDNRRTPRLELARLQAGILGTESSMPLACGFGRQHGITDYLGMDSCIVQERCSGCGAVRGEAVVVHIWGWIDRNPCLSQQVCKRCGEIGQTDEREHQWRKIYRPNSHEIQKTCACGTTQPQPSAFSMFVGQEDIKRGLVILIVAAYQGGKTLDHLLLCGQSGIGKTALAKIIATEIGVNPLIVSGKSLERAGTRGRTHEHSAQGGF